MTLGGRQLAELAEPAGGGRGALVDTDSIVWVDEVDPATAVAVAGSKMGGLTELPRGGGEVPQGFAVTVEAYRRHCADSGLDGRIEQVLAGLGTDPSEQEVEQASATIRDLFTATAMSASLEAEIVAAYEELSHRCVEVNPP